MNEQLAKATLNAIQQVHGGVITGLRIEWGTYHAFFEITKTKSGGVEIIGDGYAAPISFDQFKSLFMQQYNAQAVAMALQRMGYRTQQVKLPKEPIFFPLYSAPNA